MGIERTLIRFLYSAGIHVTGHKKILQYQKLFRATEDYDLQQICQFQLEKINKLLRHAYETTKYYKSLLQGIGIKPKIDDLQALQEIPILTRGDIQQNLSKLVSKKYSDQELVRNATGGSTGHPLVFYEDRNQYDFSAACQNHNFSTMGYSVGDKMAYLWGSDRDYRLRNICVRIRDTILRCKFLNTFDSSEEQMRNYALLLSRFKPKLLIGYASSLRLFAEIADKFQIPGIHPIAIQSSAETLFDEHRKYIEKVFNTKIFNYYGSREVDSIAHECEMHNGLHEIFQMSYVELLGNKIIVTNLWNLGMPLIRYEIGDAADAIIYTQCSCGRASKRLRAITGKISDIIKAPNGKLVHGAYFTHLFYGAQGIRQFQVVQEKPRLLTVRIVGSKNKNFELRLTNRIRREVDSSFLVDFEYVDEIPVQPSGKFRFVISKVSRNSICQ